MTNNEINTEIAKILGWKEVFEESPKDCYGLRGYTPDLDHPSFGKWRIAVPDYCSDLNAMFEAQDYLQSCPDGIIQKYESFLSENQKGWTRPTEACMCATAMQRAIAFLKTFDIT